MSHIVKIRDIPEATYVQIPNDIVYGEGVYGNLNFRVTRVDKTEKRTNLYGMDTAGNKFKLVFDEDQGGMRARVFTEGLVSRVLDLEKGEIVIIPDHRGNLSVAEVVSNPVSGAAETVVGLRTADGKARNYRFPVGELVELYPKPGEWDHFFEKGDTGELSDRALKYREPDAERERA